MFVILSEAKDPLFLRALHSRQRLYNPHPVLGTFVFPS